MESVKRKWGAGHIKAISNKNLNILDWLKSKFPQISAPKLAEKFKKEDKKLFNSTNNSHCGS